LWQIASQAEQPIKHLSGCITTGLPFWKAKTPFEQNSTHRGFSRFAQPSHLSGKTVGYQVPHECDMSFTSVVSMLTILVKQRKIWKVYNNI
jgi:hypothetical protein